MQYIKIIKKVRKDRLNNIQGVPKKERHFKYICKVANN